MHHSSNALILYQALANELERVSKYPFLQCTNMKVLDDLTYTDCVQMLVVVLIIYPPLALDY